MDVEEEQSVAVLVLRLGTTPISAELSAALTDLANSPLRVVTVLIQNPRSSVDAVTESKELHEFTEVLRLQANVGYAAAMNAGNDVVRSHNCQVLLFVTNDVSLECGSLSSLIGAAEGDVAIAAPVIEVTKDAVQQWQVGGSWSKWYGWARHRHTHIKPTVESTVDWADGACLAVQRRLFDEVGGFDDGTFLYAEDVQLAVRMRQAGYRVVVTSDTVIAQSSGMHRRSGAHGYLLIRNELRCAQRTAGPLSLAGTFTFSLVRVGVEVGRTLANTVLRSPLQKHHFRQSIGMAVGVFDAIRGRHGKPPSFLNRWAAIPD